MTAVRFATCVIALSLAAPARAADVAELFPADTLAYAEVSRPAALTDALAALTKGTPLADPLRFTHDRLDKAVTHQDAANVRHAGLLALLASPEFLAEAKRLHGAAVAVTGFTPRHEPRVATAVLLGDSPAAGLAVRAYLTAGPDVRRVGAVDGVPVYQHSAMSGPITGPDGKPRPADDGPPATAAGEPTYAYVPGLFVVGSDRDAVADVLRRFAGKADGPSLATAPGFLKHRADREKPGVFFYADPPALFARLDAASKAQGGRVDPDLVALVRFAAGPKAVKSLAGNLTLSPDALTLSAEAEFDPAVPSRLAAVLTGPAAPRFVPDGCAWTFTASLPPRDRRAKAVLALADAVAQASGALGQPPSVAAKDVGDLIATVAAVSVFAPVKQDLPASAVPLPVVVLHTDGPDDRWDADGAKVLALLAGSDRPAVSSELIGDVRVFTVPAAGLPGNAPWHYARGRQVVAFGQDRKLVAGVVTKTPTPAGPDGPVGVGLVHPSRVLESIAATVKRPVAPPARAGGTEDLSTPPEPFIYGLARAARPLPAVPVTLTRGREKLRVELRLADPGKPLSAAAVGFRDWLVQRWAAPTPPRPGPLQLDR